MTIVLIAAFAFLCSVEIFIIALIVGAWLRWCGKDDPTDIDIDYSGGM